ncbi:uncharacterized protein DNG_06138 [Cephalotrichum gorgonifer]|uniref:Subtilisin-like serine protease n=1 Tax=Cephalotrichum gorgonifer TaxID=2041049 RepID=A0AAE8MZD4_9PEZI|nr:uncharacterized protein DNG_06138 [Cephalotrichum gorgonifer]
MRRDARWCPFSADDQLVDTDTDFDLELASGAGYLPGHPLVPLSASSQLGEFLEAELCCNDLEKMAPHLWTMSTQSSASIRPLHRQRLLGREILVTESPRLHLVWYYDRVFIKPVPRYLLSYDFWTTYLVCDNGGEGRGRGRVRGGDDKDGGVSLSPPSSDALLGGVNGRADKVRRAALGFIRTYRHLIRHESDLQIARAVGLVPASTTWLQFCAFVSRFDDAISDDDVSGRYRYGDLRLTRLNFYCMFFLRRSVFEYLPTQYSTYFSRYFGPLLFVFAALSVVLSAMQLDIAVQETTETALFGSAWAAYRWFSVVVIMAAFLTSAYLGGHVVYMIAGEWVFALSARRKRLRNERRAAAEG